MLARTIPALFAGALLVASSARAESAPAASAPPAADGIERAIVFAALEQAPGPRRREAPPTAPCADLGAVRAVALDWTSPVFVWIEEGYAYVETTLAF
jgi:hypothetical protein